LEFGHAICGINLRLVTEHLLAIDSALASERDMVFNHMTKQLEPLFSRRIYASAIDPDSTIVWAPKNYTELFTNLSHRVESRIPWVWVSEPMRVRAFLLFGGGDVLTELLDPEQQQRTNTWSGRDFIGSGVRRFKTLDEFLAEIKPWIVPQDWLWNFGRWNNPEWRQELMQSPLTRMRWSLEIAGRDRSIVPIGAVPEDVRAWLAEFKNA
jgi:hypothetical protein